jgi:site-specific recombinase XerD
MAKYPLPIPLIDTLENFSVDQVTDNQGLAAVIDFLQQYSANKATFESYRRETERLLQWGQFIAQKCILTLKRQDLHDYIEFCLDPPKSWIGTKRVPRFIEHQGQRLPNSQWRPFVVSVTKRDHKLGALPDKGEYQLSQKAIQEIFTVLSSFYNYLVLDEKVSNNPVALIRQKSKFIQKQQTQPTVMRLSERQWQQCLSCAQTLADIEPNKHARTLFILSALYLLYLRISELVASDRWIPQMNHFHQDSNERWWFKTLGKGNKLRSIAVSDDMIAALKTYRLSMGLSELPSPNDQTSLLPKEKGKGAITSSRHIRRIVQNCFDLAVAQLRESKHTSEADQLEAATVHWLRHTGISDDINKRDRPIAHVRDDAGHSSSAITDRYNDIELTERHLSAKQKKL